MSVLKKSSILSPTSKQQNPELIKLYYEPPQPLQFIAYSLVLKESGMGFSSHERLLLFDSMTKSLRYLPKVPSKMPTPQENMPDCKEVIFIKKMKNFEFKSTKTSIGKAQVKWTDLNGEKKIWNLTFKNNYLMNDWVIMVNQTLKDGHLRLQNRPKSTQRKVTKRSMKGYMTPFMMATGGYQRKSSNGEQSSMLKDENWLSDMIKKKEKQVDNIHIQSQGHKQFKQKRMEMELKNKRNEKTLKPPLTKIAAINQDENQSKQSVRQENEMQTKSIKQFRYQTDFPPTIQETDNSLQQNQAKKNQQQINSQTLQHDIESPRGSKEQVFLFGKRPKINKQENENDKNKQEFNQFYDKVQKILNQSSATAPYNVSPSLPNCQWLSQTFLPFTYANFITQCQSLCKIIINNVKELTKYAKQSPYGELYMQRQNLIVMKNYIEFRINDKIDACNLWSQNMQQYSNMLLYINKCNNLNNISSSTKYNKVIVLPYTLVYYKWYTIECRSVVPLSPIINPASIDKHFEVPANLWKYYEQGKTVYIDCAPIEPILNNGQNNDEIMRVCMDLCRQTIQISSLKDLQLHCQYEQNLYVSKSVLCQIIQKINQYDNPHIYQVLISILYGIQSCLYIKEQLSTKRDITSCQMYEAIDFYLKCITVQKNGRICESIQNAICKSINRRVNKGLDNHIIFNTILFELGLQISNINNKSSYDSNNSKIHNIHFIPYAQQISPSCLSQHMIIILDIIKNSQLLTTPQQKRYQDYQTVKQQLNQFQILWGQAQANDSVGNQKKHGRFQNKKKYLGSYYRIMHYLSLYKTYQITISSQPHPFSLELQQIISETPPCYFSYLIGINCLKWTIKISPQNHNIISLMFNSQITACKQWTGTQSTFLLAYYQLYAMYAEQICDMESALCYARYSLELVVEIYGQWAAETAEKWFLLANVLVEGELIQQAVEAYIKSLQVLRKCEKGMAESGLTSSRQTLLSWRLNTSEAELLIHSKLMKSYLALGQTTKCLDQCSICHHQISNQFNSNPFQLLQVLGTIIRCYQITKETNKLTQMIEIVGTQFGERFGEFGEDAGQNLQEEERIRENMIKICLAPYLQIKLTYSNRKKCLFRILQSIRHTYENRYNKRQYNLYLTKIIEEQIATKQYCSVIQWFSSVLQKLPIFNTDANRSWNRDFQPISMNYTLYDNIIGFKIQPITQPKSYIEGLRALQAVSGVIGYTYLQQCFYF